MCIAALIGVDIHIGHAEAGQNANRCGCDALKRALRIFLDQLGGDAILRQVMPQLHAHGGCQSDSRFAHQYGKPPRLAIMRRRRTHCSR